MHWSYGLVGLIIAVLVGAYLGSKMPQLNLIGKVLP